MPEAGGYGFAAFSLQAPAGSPTIRATIPASWRAMVSDGSRLFGLYQRNVQIIMPRMAELVT